MSELVGDPFVIESQMGADPSVPWLSSSQRCIPVWEEAEEEMGLLHSAFVLAPRTPPLLREAQVPKACV